MSLSKVSAAALTSSLFSLGIITSPILFADQTLISDDGREVMIRDDGTWSFISNDRFANTKDGRRIRLKEDGSWVYVGNAPLKTSEQVRTTTVDIRFQKVKIETHQVKVQKNIREHHQTVFYLDVDLSPLAKEALQIHDIDLSRIQVEDDKGNTFPVISINPASFSLAPNSSQVFTIRAKDAPSAIWDGAKLVKITIAPGIFNNPEPITFSRKLDDIEEKKVDGFDKE